MIVLTLEVNLNKNEHCPVGPTLSDLVNDAAF